MLFSRKSWLAGLVLPLAALVAFTPARAVEPDPLVPTDSEIVLGVNLQQILQAPVIKKYALEQLKTLVKANEDAQKFIQGTGLDPLQDVDSILITNAGTNPAASKLLVVLRGKYDVAKIQAAAEKVAEDKGKLKIVQEGGYKVYEMKQDGGSTSYTLVLDKNTILISTSKDYLLKATRSVEAPGRTIAGAIKKVPGGESLWMAGVVTDELKKTMASNPRTAKLADKLQAATGSINLTDGVALNLQVHTTDAASAKELGTIVEGLKPLLLLTAMGQNDEDVSNMAKELADSIKVASDAGSVSVSLKITDELIGKALKKLGVGQ